MSFPNLISNFFTHKDFLPPADQIPGTLFTPLHLLFSALWAGAVIVLALRIAKKEERVIRLVFAILWGAMVVFEVSKIIWETVCGATISFEWGGILPLYPCSIFLYAMPFAIWGKGLIRRAACGYVCTLGMLGGAINFVYPANVLSNYSCLSFAGFHTLIYHATILGCALIMLLSRYHKYTGITKWWELILPATPFLIVSVVAHIVNFSPVGSDYMFFKLNSFFFAPLGAALPDWATVTIVYVAYFIIHALPYIPSFVSNKKKQKQMVNV